MLAANSGVWICPTRELALQKHDLVRQMGYSSFLAIPGERVPRNVTAQVVIGTPGKVQVLFKKKLLRDSRALMIDDAEHLEGSMMAQVLDIRLKLPKDLKVGFFATTWSHDLAKLSKSMVSNPSVITELTSPTTSKPKWPGAAACECSLRRARSPGRSGRWRDVTWRWIGAVDAGAISK
ncbi:helC [Symbiodinium sp. CCMP2456]|nr:helC [Symbiodinium sp. CCMP2456]